jgi:hypothetical protein
MAPFINLLNWRTLMFIYSVTQGTSYFVQATLQEKCLSISHQQWLLKYVGNRKIYITNWWCSQSCSRYSITQNLFLTLSLCSTNKDNRIKPRQDLFINATFFTVTLSLPSMGLFPSCNTVLGLPITTSHTMMWPVVSDDTNWRDDGSSAALFRLLLSHKTYWRQQEHTEVFSL